MQLLWPHTTNPPVLAADEAHVWAVPLAANAAARDALCCTLATDERARAEEFYFDDPRRRFVVARGALRVLLGRYLGVRAGRHRDRTREGRKTATGNRPCRDRLALQPVALGRVGADRRGARWRSRSRRRAAARTEQLGAYRAAPLSPRGSRGSIGHCERPAARRVFSLLDGEGSGAQGMRHGHYGKTGHLSSPAERKFRRLDRSFGDDTADARLAMLVDASRRRAMATWRPWLRWAENATCDASHSRRAQLRKPRNHLPSSNRPARLPA